MARGFVEKYKRKSLLAALLFVFQGRVKYVTILLLVVAGSLPFVFTSETFGRMLDMPPVVAVIRALHLNGIVSAMNLNPKYSSEFVKNVMDKAAADSAQSSYWNRLMGAVNSALPCGASGCSDVSSMAMIKGGEDLYNEPAKKHPAPGEVTGVVSPEEKARGEGANTVDLEGILGGGAGGGSGLYGDVMGQNLAERYSHGDGAGPYVDRSIISNLGRVGDRQVSIYNNAMHQTVGMIPVPGRAQKVPAAMHGRASSFSWKNVGYKTKSDTVDKKIGSKRPMFQLAQTYSVNGAVLESRNSAYEYQAAYEGSTFDGNNINNDIIQTQADSGSPIAPSAFVDPEKISTPDGQISDMVTVPTAVPPADVSPWQGMPQKAMSLILKSAALSIVGALLVSTGQALMCCPYTFAAGLAMYIAGIIVCIAALMMAIAAIMIGIALMTTFGQVMLGSIYTIGGGFAAAAAIMAMTGIAGIVGVLWLAGIASIIGALGMMAAR